MLHIDLNQPSCAFHSGDTKHEVMIPDRLFTAMRSLYKSSFFSYLFYYGIAKTTVRCKRFQETPVRNTQVILWKNLDFSLVYLCSPIYMVNAPRV